MRSLKECIDAALATPSNTPGMGNPTLPTETTPGSEPFPIISKKKKKKKLNKPL